MTGEIDLRAYIRDVPHFPQPGILFRDVTPLLKHPPALKLALDAMQAKIEGWSPNAIVAIESRGFVFGAPLADRLGLPLLPIRKPGKLPAAHMSIEYALEYGEGQLDIHSDALSPGERVVIVDDLLATGGTAAAAVQLVGLLGARVVGLAFLIELAELDGRKVLAPHDVYTLISYP